MTFKDLAIGQEFDWINPDQTARNSFFARCVKISDRKYQSGKDLYVVGSVHAAVFNVKGE